MDDESGSIRGFERPRRFAPAMPAIRSSTCVRHPGQENRRCPASAARGSKSLRRELRGLHFGLAFLRGLPQIAYEEIDAVDYKGYEIFVDANGLPDGLYQSQFTVCKKMPDGGRGEIAQRGVVTDPTFVNPAKAIDEGYRAARGWVDSQP
jgi:hypothetical protein